MKNQDGYINLDLGGVLIAAIVVGTVVGVVFSALAYLVLPWAWELLKPLIHGWTA